MKRKMITYIGLAIFFLFLSACSAPAAPIPPTATGTTPPEPTKTLTPEPTATATPPPTETLTATIEPTPTLALSDVVQQTYLDIQVIYKQDFGDNLNLAPFSPVGWQADGEKLFTTSDAALEINGRNTVAFYADETITLKEAVVLRFKFTPQSSFSIGIDGASRGKRIPAFQPGFRSVTMDFRNSPLVFFNSDLNHYYTRFEGDLKPQPDIWYMYTLGFAQGKEVVIKVWDPENPEKILSYRKQVAEMPNANLFIMWVNQNDKLFIDDFTIITFSALK